VIIGHPVGYCEVLLKRRTETPGQPCGFPRHLLIMIYDSLVVLSVLMLATLLAILAGFGGKTALKDPLSTLYLLTAWYAYLAWCWHSGGMTVGMRAWRVKIEDIKGERPGWRKTAIRFVVSLVSAAPFGLGYIWSLFDRDKRTWHDILSGTRLVRY